MRQNWICRGGVKWGSNHSESSVSSICRNPRWGGRISSSSSSIQETGVSRGGLCVSCGGMKSKMWRNLEALPSQSQVWLLTGWKMSRRLKVNWNGICYVKKKTTAAEQYEVTWFIFVVRASVVSPLARCQHCLCAACFWVDGTKSTGPSFGLSSYMLLLHFDKPFHIRKSCVT